MLRRPMQTASECGVCPGRFREGKRGLEPLGGESSGQPVGLPCISPSTRHLISHNLLQRHWPDDLTHETTAVIHPQHSDVRRDSSAA